MLELELQFFKKERDAVNTWLDEFTAKGNIISFSIASHERAKEKFKIKIVFKDSLALWYCAKRWAFYQSVYLIAE